MNKKLLFKQIVAITMVILLFFMFNYSVYMLVTSRLSNNFSGWAEKQKIDAEVKPKKLEDVL